MGGKRLAMLILGGSLVQAGLVTAQPRSEAMRRGREAAVRRFEAAAPRIGEPMPDLTLYDDRGRDAPLRELLQGHYTVLVLGCLT